MMTLPQAESDNQMIIDDLAIIRIKRYIERKHPHFTSSQRAALLANAVHRIIDRHLPDFEEQTKVALRQELLTLMGFKQHFTLLTEHILEACIKLDLEKSGMAQLVVWMEKYHLTGLEEATTPRKFDQPTSKKGWRVLSLCIMLMALVIVAASPQKEPIVTKDIVQIEEAMQVSQSVLPNQYKYRALNEEKLKTWLQSRKSLLAEAPFFTAIIMAAQEYDINPLLLFAITGQEQAFVPKDSKQSKQIANNPFNIYNSWKTYNTNIVDSARIASRTIVSISRERPSEVDPIVWLNTKYAEDPNWWIGVSSIFEKMSKEIDREQ